MILQRPFHFLARLAKRFDKLRLQPSWRFTLPTFLVGSIFLFSSGCQSLLTSHHAAYQPSGCDSLNACAGYTETRWTSLESCDWEESFSPIQNHAVYEEEFLEQPIRVEEHVSTYNPDLDQREIEQASYLTAEDQSENDPSLNEEVLKYSESLLLSATPTELESQDAQHENQLDEVSVEYLQQE